jgi:hypothetical protein
MPFNIINRGLSLPTTGVSPVQRLPETQMFSKIENEGAERFMMKK